MRVEAEKDFSLRVGVQVHDLRTWINGEDDISVLTDIAMTALKRLNSVIDTVETEKDLEHYVLMKNLYFLQVIDICRKCAGELEVHDKTYDWNEDNRKKVEAGIHVH